MTWNMKRLGDVVTVVRRINNGKPLPYVGMEHISSGTGEFLGDSAPVVVKSNTFKFEPGQLLYGRLRPYLNKVLLPNFSGHCSTEVFPLQPSGELDKRFLFYWITSEPVVNSINATCTGARMPRANVDAVLDFEVPVPPLAEQQRIVTKLDAAFGALREAEGHVERNRANARDLFESYLNGVFEGKEGWVTAPLGEVCDILNGSTPARTNKAYWENGTVPWFTIDDIREQGTRIRRTRQAITEHALEDTSVKLLPKQSVLLCCTASVGAFAIAEIPLSTNQQFNGLVVKAGVDLDPYFLMHVASTLKPKLLNKSGKTTIDFVPISRLREIQIAFPRQLGEQRRIVSQLDLLKEQCTQLEATYQQKLRELEGLKKGLLGAAFRGEL